MQLSFIPFFLLSAAPIVFACEGKCIVDITNAFIGNYSTIVDGILAIVANKISDLVPHHPRNSPPAAYVQPIMEAYRSQAYTSMETAIFPSYFHGKCLFNGVEPSGCPNPDCPVVCGTPGSLIHFYSKLCFIAFQDTRHLLGNITSPGSEPYKLMEHMVIKDATRPTPRGLRMYSRSRSRYPPVDLLSKRSEVADDTGKIMGEVPGLLGQACGGDDLSKCTWETTMKKLILSFP